MNKDNKQNIWVLGTIAVVVLGFAFLIYYQNHRSGDYDQLAQCLTDKGAKFYGAFWCPHCQREKAMFGNSARLLPYVECSTADGQGQLPVCNEKNIDGYPTWIFADGSRMSGEIAPKDLAAKAGCTLPGQTVTPTSSFSKS